MTDPRSHADHDPQQIAAHAAADLSGRARDEAVRLVAGCPDCAVLHADLLALAEATRELPRPVRPRDFTLSADDAARLRPAGWRRLAAALAGPRFALAQPLGAVFATLGLAGLLLATLPGVPLAGGAAAPADQPASMGYGPAQASRMPDTLGGDAVTEQERMNSGDPQPVEAPGLRSESAEGGAAAGSGNDTGAQAGRDAALAERAADTTLAILSGSFLIVGIAFIGLRWTAGRLGD